jgi:hypothetical protein
MDLKALPLSTCVSSLRRTAATAPEPSRGAFGVRLGNPFPAVGPQRLLFIEKLADGVLRNAPPAPRLASNLHAYQFIMNQKRL